MRGCAGEPTGEDAPSSQQIAVSTDATPPLLLKPVDALVFNASEAAAAAHVGAPAWSLREIRNLVLLWLCWGLTLSASTLISAIGPIALKLVSGSDAFGPFAVGGFLLGAALISIPSSKIFRRCGRRGGFLVGCALSVMGGVAGSLAIYLELAWMLVLACFSAGMAQGLGQFYRFAAVEVCHHSRRAVAMTAVLTGGVFAAFVGPQVGEHTSHALPGRMYFGSFAAVAALGVLNALAVACSLPHRSLAVACSLVRYPQSTGRQGPSPPQRELLLDAAEQSDMAVATRIDSQPVPEAQRPKLVKLLLQPRCALAIALETAAHTSMSLLMVPLALAMEERGFEADLVTLTFELHFVTMFAPGLITGRLIARIGSAFTAAAGTAFFVAAITTLFLGTSFGNFLVGMALCGLAWNLVFSAGSVMLTECYSAEDATRVQGVNDFVVFFVSGSCSAAVGIAYSLVGWRLVVSISTLIVGFLVLLFPFLRKLHFSRGRCIT